MNVNYYILYSNYCRYMCLYFIYKNDDIEKGIRV